jgi:hypothetical protein
VKALSPIYRAIFTQQGQQAGLLPHLDPHLWTIPWHVHSQAKPHGHPAFTSLAPDGFKVAISNRRIVSRKDCTVPFTSRTPGSARQRAPHLDASAFLRRFLPHVLPDGFMTLRHVGLMNSRCAIPPDTMRLLIVTHHPGACNTPHVEAPAPCVASCPTCGAPMRVVMRLWASNRVLLETG